MSPGLIPHSQGLTSHPQGLTACPQGSPYAPWGLNPCPKMVSRGHQTPAEPQYPQHRACAGVLPTQVAT